MYKTISNEYRTNVWEVLPQFVYMLCNMYTWICIWYIIYDMYRTISTEYRTDIWEFLSIYVYMLYSIYMYIYIYIYIHTYDIEYRICRRQYQMNIELTFEHFYQQKAWLQRQMGLPEIIAWLIAQKGTQRAVRCCNTLPKSCNITVAPSGLPWHPCAARK